MFQDIKDNKLFYYENEVNITDALLTNKIGITLNGKQYFYQLQQRYPGRFEGIPFQDANGNSISLPVSMAFKKNDKILLPKFNVYLKQLKFEKKYQILLDKYHIH